VVRRVAKVAAAVDLAEVEAGAAAATARLAQLEYI
jgi:hypothetical protein